MRVFFPPSMGRWAHPPPQTLPEAARRPRDGQAAMAACGSLADSTSMNSCGFSTTTTYGSSIRRPTNGPGWAAAIRRQPIVRPLSRTSPAERPASTGRRGPRLRATGREGATRRRPGWARPADCGFMAAGDWTRKTRSASSATCGYSTRLPGNGRGRAATAPCLCQGKTILASMAYWASRRQATTPVRSPSLPRPPTRAATHGSLAAGDSTTTIRTACPISFGSSFNLPAIGAGWPAPL